MQEVDITYRTNTLSPGNLNTIKNWTGALFLSSLCKYICCQIRKGSCWYSVIFINIYTNILIASCLRDDNRQCCNVLYSKYLHFLSRRGEMIRNYIFWKDRVVALISVTNSLLYFYCFILYHHVSITIHLWQSSLEC